MLKASIQTIALNIKKIKNKKPIFTIKDSLDVLTVCDAISRSIKTSKEIEIKYL